MNELAETLNTESMDENGVYKVDISLFDYDAAKNLEYRLQTKLRYLDSTRQSLGEYYASEQSTALNKSFDYNGGAFNTLLTTLGLGTITEKVTSKASTKDENKHQMLDSTLAKTLSSIGNSKLFTGALLAGFIFKAGVTAAKWGYSKSCGFIAKSEIERSRRALMDEMRQANRGLSDRADTYIKDYNGIKSRILKKQKFKCYTCSFMSHNIDNFILRRDDHTKARSLENGVLLCERCNQRKSFEKY